MRWKQWVPGDRCSFSVIPGPARPWVRAFGPAALTISLVPFFHVMSTRKSSRVSYQRIQSKVRHDYWVSFVSFFEAIFSIHNGRAAWATWWSFRAVSSSLRNSLIVLSALLQRKIRCVPFWAFIRSLNQGSVLFPRRKKSLTVVYGYNIFANIYPYIQ